MWEQSTSGSIQSVELQRSLWVRVTWCVDLWWRLSHVTFWALCRVSPGGDWRGRGGGGDPRSHVATSTYSAVFLLLSLFLYSPCGCFLNCISTGQNEVNKKLLRVKMKVLWHYLPPSLSGANRELLSDLSYAYFFPLFYFQSWQPHKSSIQAGRAKDAGCHERSVSCPPGPPSLCAVSATYY